MSSQGEDATYQPCSLLQEIDIIQRESSCLRAIHIQDADDSAVDKQRHDHLASARGVTRDMYGKRMDIGNHQGLPPCPCRSADSFAVRDLRARHSPLEGAEHEGLVCSDQVETHPVYPIKSSGEQRAGILQLVEPVVQVSMRDGDKRIQLFEHFATIARNWFKHVFSPPGVLLSLY